MTDTPYIELKHLTNGTLMGVHSFLHIAITLAEMVQSSHKRDTVIGDLNPANIRIRSESHSAGLVEQRRPDYAYFSPEQTGKINRAPDVRSDLYALGMMYYEMLAGRLPFGAQSDEEWVHAHLAIVPRPLGDLRPDLQGPLSDIIMKLLSKMPEERYQSAFGLLSDLQRCVASLAEKGELLPFDIARTDDASRFRLPHALFGRETEVKELRMAFERARAGASAFVFVTGRAGIGKTALIRELQLPVTSEGGQFIAGKCDLMNRDIPLSPILQALRRLIRQIWSESHEKVAAWKVRLTDALGGGADVIAELLPEASMLLGGLHSVEPLLPAESAIRLRRLFSQFIQVFADREHPLVIFLDDLQWADPATLDVLRGFAHDPTLHDLLVIGAYRSETASDLTESGDDHAGASCWIEDTLSFHKAETPPQVQHIKLEPLSYIDVRRFASDMLNENTSRVRLLAELLYHRTGGNPLYLHRFLDGLYREKKLYFDEEQAAWTWDAAGVSQMPEDPDILHLIGARLSTLPQQTLGLLAIAAAIGHRFYPGTIAQVSGYSLSDTLQILHAAGEEGLIWRNEDLDQGEEEKGSYTFIHDGVQQAAYRTVPEPDKADLHLRIGRVMLHHESDRMEESIFDIVYHLNLGCSKMEQKTEKRELVAYNLQAGLKSKAATAFASALRFLETGLHQLGDEEGGEDSLFYRLMLELPECEYMCGRVDRAEEILDRLMSCTADLIKRSHIYLTRIGMNSYLRRDDIALNIALQALAEFGWELPLKPSKMAIIKELAQTEWALYRMRDNLPSLPVNRDPTYKALADLVMTVAASAFISSPELTVLLYPRFLRYGLKHGNNEAFAFVLGFYGLVLTFRSRRYKGSRLIQTAYLLSFSFGNSALKSRVHYIMGLFETIRNPAKAVEHFEQSVSRGLESADLVSVCFSMMTRVTTHIGDLHTLSARITYYEEASRQLLDDITLNIFRIARWYMDQLQKETSQIDEIVVPVDGIRFHKKLDNEAFYYCTCNIEITYLAGRYRETLEWAQRGRFNSFRQTGLQIRKQYAYECLALAALYEEAPQEERKSIRKQLGKQLRSQIWYGYHDRNSSAYRLVTAELQRIDGKQVAAAKAYEEAIAASRAEEYVVMEAIACERASIFYKETGIDTAADALLADAIAAYSRWGAAAKVRRLREESSGRLPLSVFPPQENFTAAAGAAGIQIVQERRTSKASPWTVPEDGQDASAHEMVLFKVNEKVLIRQIAGWSATADNQDLLNRFLESALRYSGAQKGYVLNKQGDEFYLEAEAGGMDDKQEGAAYAESVVRYVIMTGEAVLLADASSSSYAADPYIRRCHPQSVVCMPVLFPGNLLSSVLYLENNLISGVFTDVRLKALDIMITRMVYLKSLADARTRADGPDDSGHSPEEAVSTKVSQQLADPLTNRETEILYALSDGLSNKEIAFRFGLTEGTVKSHVFRLYGKLGVNRRGQAIARARQLQLID